MRLYYFFVLIVFIPLVGIAGNISFNEKSGVDNRARIDGFTNAADFGFSPEASGVDNAKALQKAVDCGGTIVISKPGIYKLGGTVFVWK